MLKEVFLQDILFNHSCQMKLVLCQDLVQVKMRIPYTKNHGTM